LGGAAGGGRLAPCQGPGGGPRGRGWRHAVDNSGGDADTLRGSSSDIGGVENERDTHTPIRRRYRRQEHAVHMQLR
jgi:hypothetical protein